MIRKKPKSRVARVSQQPFARARTRALRPARSVQVRVPERTRTGASLDLPHAKRLLRAMQQELARSKKGLKQQGEPAPFFLSYLLHAKEGLSVWGRYGSVFRSEPQRDCDLYVEAR